MKKVSFWAVTAAVACLSLVGCKNKSENSNAAGEEQNASSEQTEATAEGEDTTVASLDDDYMVCPFCIQVEGKVDADGNPVTEDRKWICGTSVGVSTVADWVLYTQDPRFGFNVDGWHFVGKDIVNAAETYKIVDEDAEMSLSSYCTIRTEKYKKPETVTPYEHVSFSHLYTVEGAEMEAPLIKTSGNRHDYTGEVLEYIEDKELQDRVETSFYLQEWVKVELPAELADADVIVAVVPYQTKYEGVTYDADKLAETLWNGKPEKDDETGHAAVSFYVSEEQPVGFYDVLLIQGQKVQHRLTLAMSAEKK